MSQPQAMTSASASGSAGPISSSADLVKLAEAALLRPLIAEHRPGVEDFLGQRLGQPVGYQGAADAGGAFRSQREQIAATVIEDIHLLRDDVGGFAQGAGEDAGVLEDRGHPFVKAIIAGNAAGDVRHTVEAALFLADQVVGAAGGLQGGQLVGHGWSLVLVPGFI